MIPRSQVRSLPGPSRVHRFADANGAIEAGSALGTEAAPGRGHFAGGKDLVVVEADDSALTDAAVTLLEQAARDVR